jgi:hypothetical protein
MDGKAGSPPPEREASKLNTRCVNHSTSVLFVKPPDEGYSFEGAEVAVPVASGATAGDGSSSPSKEHPQGLDSPNLLEPQSVEVGRTVGGSGGAKPPAKTPGKRSTIARQGGGEAPCYLDSPSLPDMSIPTCEIDKSDSDFASFLPSRWLEDTCDKPGHGYFTWAQCDDCGTRYGKEIVCGKPWCKVCGEKGSVAHDRRFAKWVCDRTDRATGHVRVGKLRQMKVVGSFVFTLPREVRHQYRTKESLQNLRKGIRRILKMHDFHRGLSMFHWFGDRGTDYHPHDNEIVDGRYLKRGCFKQCFRCHHIQRHTKKEPANFCEECGTSLERVRRIGELDMIKLQYAAFLGVAKVDIHYEYLKSPSSKVHLARYVTRATFLDYNWDRDMALELKDFRNMVSWGGLWDGPAVWELKEVKSDEVNIDQRAIESLSSGICPDCGGELEIVRYRCTTDKKGKKHLVRDRDGNPIPVYWHDALPKVWLEITDKEELGAGYWRLKDRPPPKPALTVDDKWRLYLMKVRWLGKVSRSLERKKVRELYEASEDAEYREQLWRDLINMGTIEDN